MKGGLEMEKYLGIDGKERDMPNLSRLMESWEKNPEEEEKEKEAMNAMFEQYVVSGKLKENGLTTLGIFESTVRNLKTRIKTNEIYVKGHPGYAEESNRQIRCIKWMIKGLERRIRKLKKEK